MQMCICASVWAAQTTTTAPTYPLVGSTADARRGPVPNEARESGADIPSPYTLLDNIYIYIYTYIAPTTYHLLLTNYYFNAGSAAITTTETFSAKLAANTTSTATTTAELVLHRRKIARATFAL